jgi:ATP-dependent Clp protease ATP-binding subunit ClpA
MSFGKSDEDRFLSDKAIDLVDEAASNTETRWRAVEP